ncbi:hypothetical protein HPB52_018400 [Rhipicephalus sanguineus]|uniref:Uncharacterized protein n=1 Tax=Rhipicephalus sanguineus TaxID=34632 RepID=A0A9D4SZL4_RHISA|nr:hypothetical protein HPB52_018400 [Rhipicephalus sanguineus]
MAHDADPRGDSHLAGTVADVAAAPFSALPVKEIAVKDFVPVHLAGSAGATKVIGAHNSLAKVKNACHFEPDVPYATGVRAAIRSSSPELRRSPREDNNRRSSSLLTRYIQFPSDGSLLTESSAFREQRSLQRLAGHIPCGPGRAVLRRTKLRAQRDRASSSCLPGASSLRRLERPPASSESRGRCQLDRRRPSGCRQQKRRRVRVSSSSRTDDYEDDLLLARLEDHAACAKLSLSELRCPAGKLRTSDMFVGGGRRCRSADVVEVARNVVIWVLVLSGTATIMFGAVGIIVLRTGSVMFLSSAVGSVLTTAGVLMAIYCTDASTDRGLQRMMNHKYNYT